MSFTFSNLAVRSRHEQWLISKSRGHRTTSVIPYPPPPSRVGCHTLRISPKSSPVPQEVAGNELCLLLNPWHFCCGGLPTHWAAGTCRGSIHPATVQSGRLNSMSRKHARILEKWKKELYLGYFSYERKRPLFWGVDFRGTWRKHIHCVLMMWLQTVWTYLSNVILKTQERGPVELWTGSWVKNQISREKYLWEAGTPSSALATWTHRNWKLLQNQKGHSPTSCSARNDWISKFWTGTQLSKSTLGGQTAARENCDTNTCLSE